MRGREQRGVRLLTAVSALLFGGVGWLVAHTATEWLTGHAGHGLGGDAAHSHTHVSTAALLIGCLAGGSLLAIFTVALSGHGNLDAVAQRSRRVAARRWGLLSTASFVAAEFIEHAVTGAHEIPPVAVLLLGCAIHGLAGAITSILWGYCVDDVMRLATLLLGGDVVEPGSRIRFAGRRRIARRRTWRAIAVAGRAPPADAAPA
jgi:hypothetical protein